MTDRICQDENEAIPWISCDTFRGTVDTRELKQRFGRAQRLVQCYVWLEH